MNQPEPPKMELTLEELYTIVGELEVVRRKAFMQIKSLQEEIARLKAKAGE